MVMVGIDPHKRSHTAVAVDEAGRKLGELRVAASAEGLLGLLGWAARRFAGPRCWAVEDCRGVTGRLERALLSAGEQVVRVPPRRMAAARRGAQPGKSDPIDALAVARAALQAPWLPVAVHDAASLEVKCLADHRERLLSARTAMVNQLRWQLHQLAPELHLPARRAHTPTQLGRVRELLGRLAPSAPTMVCGWLVEQIAAHTARIGQLDRELAGRAAVLVPRTLGWRGVGPVVAAGLLAQTANATRFHSEGAFAMHTGVAPVPASSGQVVRYRLNRGGDRTLNRCLHHIALSQVRWPCAGQAYYRRKLAEGKTRPEALRCLKRRIARQIYQLLVADYQARTQPATITAA